MVITCSSPTPHYPSGRALLEHYDTDNDGKLTLSDKGRAFADMMEMGITEAEFTFVDSLFAFPASDPRYGDINSKCPLLNTHSFNLIEGDNYVSLPYLPADATPSVVFGSGVIVLGYDTATASWVSVSNVMCKEGYYAYAPKAKSVTITGTECVVTLDDLVAIYDALDAGQYALIGPGITDNTTPSSYKTIVKDTKEIKVMDVTNSVLDGCVSYNYVTKAFDPIIGLLEIGKAYLEVGKAYWIGKEAIVTITFVTKKADGTELTGVSVYLDGAFAGMT